MSSIVKFYKTHIIIILVISLPIFFTLGPALIELVSLIFFVIFLVLYLKKNNEMMKLINENKLIIKFFSLFWLSLIISSFISEDYYLSFKNTGFYFRFLTFSLFILYCLDKYKQLKYLLFYTYAFLFILIFITSIYEYASGYNFFNNIPYSNRRISSIFLDEKILGSFVSKTLPIVIALIYVNKFKYKFFISFFLISMSLILVVLSGERTALLLFLIFFTLTLKISDFRKIFGLIFIFLVSVILVNPKILTNASTNRIIGNTLAQLGLPLIGNNERIRFFSPVHEHHYISGFKMFVDNPILGIGPNNFREQCKKGKYEVDKIPFMGGEKIYARTEGYILSHVGKYIYFSANDLQFERSLDEIFLTEKYDKLLKDHFDPEKKKEKTKGVKFNEGDHIFTYKKEFNISGCNTHPHNYLIQFLAETGVVGFIFYISLIIFCLYKIISILFSTNSQKYPEYLALIAILLSLFPLLPSGNFFNNMISFTIFWNLPFYLFFIKNLKNEH